MGLVGADLKPTAVRLTDDLENGQSNAASGSLGRKKRLENAAAVLGCDPYARIFHGDRNAGRALCNAGTDRTD